MMTQTLVAEAWIDVGGLDDITRLGSRTVRTGGGEIAIFRTSDDTIFALYDRCPHKGGPLSQGIVHGRSVTCPLHAWVLDLASGEAAAPDKGCAHSVPVKMLGDRILLPLGSDAQDQIGRESVT